MIFPLLAFIYLSTPEALHAVCAVGGWWLCITSFGLSRTWLCLCRSGELCWILIFILKILHMRLTHLHEPKLLLPHLISLVWSLLQPREQKTETVLCSGEGHFAAAGGVAGGYWGASECSTRSLPVLCWLVPPRRHGPWPPGQPGLFLPRLQQASRGS